MHHKILPLLTEVQALQQELNFKETTMNDIEYEYLEPDYEDADIESALGALAEEKKRLERALPFKAEISQLRTLLPDADATSFGLDGEQFFIGFTAEELHAILENPEKAANLEAQNKVLWQELESLLNPKGLFFFQIDALAGGSGYENFVLMTRDIEDDTPVDDDKLEECERIEQLFLAHFGWNCTQLSRESHYMSGTTLYFRGKGSPWKGIRANMWLQDIIEQAKTF